LTLLALSKGLVDKRLWVQCRRSVGKRAPLLVLSL
jgi:hypothetical protein